MENLNNNAIGWDSITAEAERIYPGQTNTICNINKMEIWRRRST